MAKGIGTKRPNNCFRCWHCARIDGIASCCVCMANVTKKNPPDMIYEPYRGVCLDFLDKETVEKEVVTNE